SVTSVAFLYALSLSIDLFFFSISLPLLSTLFPYTTLFRSRDDCGLGISQLQLGRGGAARSLRHTRPKSRVSSGALAAATGETRRSEEHTSELQSLAYLVCRLLLEKKKYKAPADQHSESTDV